MPDATKGVVTQTISGNCHKTTCSMGEPHFWVRKAPSRKTKRWAWVTELVSARAQIWTLCSLVRALSISPQLQKYQRQLRS